MSHVCIASVDLVVLQQEHIPSDATTYQSDTLQHTTPLHLVAQISLRCIL